MIRIIEENSEERQLDPFEVTTNAISCVFEKGGLLQTTLGLEHRPQQETMALQVCQSIQSDESLLFEAGTGVGKSLAYLLPSIFFAMAAKRPCVVA
ncbi:MAG: ATP-dependent DNA helicase, partial [Opitutales bacterium]